MPAPKTRPATSKRAKAAAAAAEDLTTSEGVAHAIRTESIDLTPSVNKIMNAGLHEAAALKAITLFRASLGDNSCHRFSAPQRWALLRSFSAANP